MVGEKISTGLQSSSPRQVTIQRLWAQAVTKGHHGRFMFGHSWISQEENRVVSCAPIIRLVRCNIYQKTVVKTAIY